MHCVCRCIVCVCMCLHVCVCVCVHACVCMCCIDVCVGVCAWVGGTWYMRNVVYMHTMYYKCTEHGCVSYKYPVQAAPGTVSPCYM